MTVMCYILLGMASFIGLVVVIMIVEFVVNIIGKKISTMI